MVIIPEEFRLPEQHDVVMDTLRLDNKIQLLEGNAIECCARLVFLLAGALAFLFLLDISLPTLAQGIMVFAAIVAAVWLTWSFLSSCNKRITDEGLLWVAKHALLLFALIVVVASVA